MWDGKLDRCLKASSGRFPEGRHSSHGRRIREFKYRARTVRLFVVKRMQVGGMRKWMCLILDEKLMIYKEKKSIAKVTSCWRV